MLQRGIIITVVFMAWQFASEAMAQGNGGNKLPPPPPPPPPHIKNHTPTCQPSDNDSLSAIQMMDVEQLPQFPGGDSAMGLYLRNTVRYPAMEKEANVQGKVYVEFVIEEDGTVSNVGIRRGVSRGLDAEAMRVIKRMPKWIPGKCNGKCVKVRYVLPINFRLAN